MSVSYDQLDLCHRHFEEVDWSNPLSDHWLNANLKLWMKAGWAGGWQGTKWFDLSREGHTGTLTAGPLWSGVSHPGGWGSLFFDGSDDYVLLRDASSGFIATPQDWTISATVIPLSVTGDHYIFSMGDTSGSSKSGFYLTLLDSDVFSIRAITGTNSDTSASSTTSAVIGRPYHVLGTKIGTDLGLYLNGVREGTAALPSATMDYSGSATVERTVIGALFDLSVANVFSGYIDDVELRDRGMQAGEVAALYQEVLAGHPTTLNWHRPRVYFDLGAAPPAGNRRRRVLICGAAA